MTSRTATVFRMDPQLRETLAGVDLFIANCEGPVVEGKKTEQGFPWISFAMEENFLRGCLEELGVSPCRCVLSVANNHMADRGLEGLRSTLDCLGRMGVATVGQRRGAPLFFFPWRGTAFVWESPPGRTGKTGEPSMIFRRSCGAGM